MPHFLDGIFLDGIRGINDLRVVFDYPVSVIAGENASGKSTVLFAAACAYKVKGAGIRFAPSTLFPDFRPRSGGRADDRQPVTLQFEYTTPEGRRSMRRWRRGKRWEKSRKKASQPERQLYLRTLSNLSNPSEVRGVLSMARMASEPQVRPLNASQIQFAKNVLPSLRYSEIVDLNRLTRRGTRQLLFATQEDGSRYSELHMAGGERSVLRLSQEIAQLHDALVLIDEVETGLHPWIQKLLMLQLQQLALRNNLQVIVTSHSPVILNSVPARGRIFLKRGDGGVTIQEPFRDIVQNALYGQSEELLNILCEDEVAEGVLQGILDVIRPELGMRSDAVRVGRDTSAQQFPQYAEAFKTFGQIRNFVFVLDGDQENTPTAQRLHDKAGPNVPVLFLPGQHAPEVWVWDQIRQICQTHERPSPVARYLGDHSALQAHMANLDSIYDSASDTPSNLAKAKLQDLAQECNQTPPQLGRVVAGVEAQRPGSHIQPLVNGLRDAIARWRSS